MPLQITKNKPKAKVVGLFGAGGENGNILVSEGKTLWDRSISYSYLDPEEKLKGGLVSDSKLLL